MSLRVEARRTAPQLAVGILVLGLACATTLRWLVSGSGDPQSVAGGLVFAACLAAMAGAAGVSIPRWPWRSAINGASGAAVLIAPAVLRADLTGWSHRSAAGLLPWLAVAGTVAMAEECFLRGALFAAVQEVRGDTAAVVVGAIAFAALHVPLYGPHVLPLDLAVGLLLGTLRVLDGNWCAPAVAHVLADAAGWWLR